MALLLVMMKVVMKAVREEIQTTLELRIESNGAERKEMKEMKGSSVTFD